MARQCEAFTKSFRPCRAYADHSTGLCRQHATWYDNLNWLFFLIHKYDILGIPGSGCRAWALRIASNGKATGDQQTIEQVFQTAFPDSTPEGSRFRARLIYDVLVQAGRIRPLQCTLYWVQTVMMVTGILSDMIVFGMHPERFQICLRDHLLAYVPTLQEFTAYVSMIPAFLESNIPVSSFPILVPRILEGMEAANPLSVSFHNRAVVKKMLEQSIQRQKARGVEEGHLCVLRELTGVVEFQLAELARTARQACKEQRDALKEELMMNRWHPDRVMRLLEAGIDVEDM